MRRGSSSHPILRPTSLQPSTTGHQFIPGANMAPPTFASPTSSFILCGKVLQVSQFGQPRRVCPHLDNSSSSAFLLPWFIYQRLGFSQVSSRPIPSRFSSTSGHGSSWVYKTLSALYRFRNWLQASSFFFDVFKRGFLAAAFKKLHARVFLSGFVVIASGV